MRGEELERRTPGNSFRLSFEGMKIRATSDSSFESEIFQDAAKKEACTTPFAVFCFIQEGGENAILVRREGRNSHPVRSEVMQFNL